MISKRASEFTSFIVMDIMAKAEELERKGEHIIHMEVGEPIFSPRPKSLPMQLSRPCKTTKPAILMPWGFSNCARPSVIIILIEYGVSITPDQVLVSTGTSPVLLFAMLAMLDHGD